MPTVILLDRSLSMARGLPKEKDGGSSDNGGLNRFGLAKRAIAEMAGFLEAHLPYEYYSLITFSDRPKIVIEFECNAHANIRHALKAIDLGDRTRIDAAIVAAVGHIASSFGQSTPCQIVLVTEGCPVIASPHALGLHTISCRLHVCQIGTRRELASSSALALLGSRTGGAHLGLEVGRSKRGLLREVRSFMTTQFAVYKGTLQFGRLGSAVRLYPPPASAHAAGSHAHDGNGVLPTTLAIVAVFRKAELDHPASVSRHIVMPRHTTSDWNEAGTTLDHQAWTDQLRQEPDFRYTLYLALQERELVALVKLAPDWFGILYPQTQGKVNNLMLAVLHRGWAVPWFAPLDSLLVPAPPRAKAADGGKKKSVWLQRDDADADTDKGNHGDGGSGTGGGTGTGETGKPGGHSGHSSHLGPGGGGGGKKREKGGAVAAAAAIAAAVHPDRFSYSIKLGKQPAYARSSRQFQAEYQKLLTLVKALPHKRSSFFKELNKVRNWALSYGMADALAGLLDFLDGVCLQDEGSKYAAVDSKDANGAATVTRAAILRDVLGQRLRFAVGPSVLHCDVEDRLPQPEAPAPKAQKAPAPKLMALVPQPAMPRSAADGGAATGAAKVDKPPKLAPSSRLAKEYNASKPTPAAAAARTGARPDKRKPDRGGERGDRGSAESPLSMMDAAAVAAAGEGQPSKKRRGYPQTAPQPQPQMSGDPAGSMQGGGGGVSTGGYPSMLVGRPGMAPGASEPRLVLMQPGMVPAQMMMVPGMAQQQQMMMQMTQQQMGHHQMGQQIMMQQMTQQQMMTQQQQQQQNQQQQNQQRRQQHMRDTQKQPQADKVAIYRLGRPVQPALGRKNAGGATRAAADKGSARKSGTTTAATTTTAGYAEDGFVVSDSEDA